MSTIIIESAPQPYKKYLRIGDAHEGKIGFDGKITDPKEAETAAAALCKKESNIDCAGFLEYLEKSNYSLPQIKAKNEQATQKEYVGKIEEFSSQLIQYSHLFSATVQIFVNSAIELAENGLPKALTALLESFIGRPISLEDFLGKYAPLHTAIRYDRLDIIKLLLDRGSDINEEDNDGYSPLHVAVRYGQADIANLLLDRGANINDKCNIYQLLINRKARNAVQKNIDGYFNYFSFHCYGANTNDEADDLVRFLLDRGGYATVNECNTQICVYVSCGTYSAFFNLKDEWNYTPLHVAVRYGQVEMVKLLLEGGADINDGAYYGFTPLHVAVRYGQVEMVKLLLEKGADINEKTKSYNHAPLYVAVRYGQVEMVKLLLERGADINAEDNVGYSPLHVAVHFQYGYYGSGKIDIMKLLLDKGANINGKGWAGNTPLHDAIRYGHGFSGKIDFVQLFLDKEAIIRLLLESGANVNEKDISGNTSLHAAVRYDQIGTIKLLLVLERGANVNEKNHDGDTPLHDAITIGKIDVVSFLLDRGANVNEKNNRGEAPLHNAIRFYVDCRCEAAVEMINLLLDRGANINEKNNRGDTPFHLADYFNLDAVVKLLLERGADINEKDKAKYGFLFKELNESTKPEIKSFLRSLLIKLQELF